MHAVEPLHFMKIKVVAMETLQINGMSVSHKNVNECKPKKRILHNVCTTYSKMNVSMCVVEHTPVQYFY